MAIDLPVYKSRRVVLLRFKRAVTGDPDPQKPDIDDRGWTGQWGPILGMMQYQLATVRITRERIDTAAKLFAVPSDFNVINVTNLAAFELPATKDVDVQLIALAGGNPTTAKLEVRYGSITGPVLHTLNIWTFTAQKLRLTPHMVTIADAANPGIGSACNIANIIDKVKAIWKPCGVDVDVKPTVNDNHTFAAAGILQASVNNAAGNEVWGPEIRTLLSASYVPNTINAYFVNQINAVSGGGLLGLGLSRATITAAGLPQPGIILGDNNAAGSHRAGDAMWLANDLAHEMGHFLQLWHPDQRQPPNERKDTWSRRMLMHNYNTMPRFGGWKDTVIGYGTGSDGFPRRGCLLTMKHLSQLTTDGESTTARATITSPAGPY